MSRLKPLYIVGAGGFGREAAWLVERINQKGATWDLRGFVDDNPSLWGCVVGGYQVHGGCPFLGRCGGDVWAALAVGGVQARREGAGRLAAYGNVHFATLIDPDARIGSRSSIGEGSVICAGAVITVDATLGAHCIVNLGCTIGHDALIGDFVTVYPSANISGCVRIVDATEIGTGAQLIQGVAVKAENSVIGAGAVVVRDIDAPGTYIGVPAKRMAVKMATANAGRRI